MKTEQYPVALLLKALGVDSLTTTDWQERTCKATGMKERTFMSKLAEIKDDPDKIVKSSDGKWTAVSPIYPPGWNATHTDGGKEKLQNCN